MNRRGFLKGLGILIGSAAIPKMAVSNEKAGPTEKTTKTERVWSYRVDGSVEWHEIKRNVVAAKTTWKKVDGGWETE